MTRRTSERRVSRLHQPSEMSLEAWQKELRRQFGSEQSFGLENIGDHPIFSDFRVTNPSRGTVYRVAIRSVETGRNFCSCADFRTNALGTCKHIEFTLAVLSARRGAKRALLAGYVPPWSSISIDYGAQRHVRFRAGRDCPPALRRLVQKYFDAEGRLKPASFPRFDDFVFSAKGMDPDLRIYDDVLAFVAEVRDARRRAEIIDAAYADGVRSPALEDVLRAPMYDYQKEGALFAARAGRSLIADEMGLGKTIQAIAAAEIMARHLGVERVLVVCPTSLKHQWSREIAVFSCRSTRVIEGLAPARAAAFREDDFFKITNYDSVHADLDRIHRWAPDLVILDEAQRIKNWSTRTARSVKQLPSSYAIVLTGTPLENRLEELVSIVDFIDPYRLGPTWRFLDAHQSRDENGRVIGYRDLDRVATTLSSVIIRRRKKDVLSQLPERLEKQFLRARRHAARMGRACRDDPPRSLPQVRLHARLRARRARTAPAGAAGSRTRVLEAIAMAKSKPLPPRRLRMNRQQRLQSARSFIRNYRGRNIARGYSRWYGVDRRCAVLELQMLGVRLTPEYIAAVLETARAQEERAIVARLERDEERKRETDCAEEEDANDNALRLHECSGGSTPCTSRCPT